jgi:hypothetical protein
MGWVSGHVVNNLIEALQEPVLVFGCRGRSLAGGTEVNHLVLLELIATLQARKLRYSRTRPIVAMPLSLS